MPLKEGIGGEREGDFTDNFIANKLKGLWVQISHFLQLGLGLKQS
jgi:hypothetical protein